MARQTAKFGMPVRFGYRYRPHPDVTAVLVRDGHGNFASLMADILTELIFGDAANVEVPDAAAA
jgi:hypothetical protein